MKWGTLGHATDLEPLLVKLYDTHRLYQLAEDKQPEAKAELSHIVSGLLDMQLKQSEKELIADILINLMRQAEKDLRHAIADRLSALDNVPLRLVLFLAQDEIGVAETVLRHSPVLNDLDLLYIIQSRDSDYWRAIAARHTLNDPVIDALADTHDLPTVCTLAGNTDITLSSYAVDIMSDMAQTSDELARPLLTRAEITETIARKLYQAVGQELEKTISSTLQNELSVLASVKDILFEFSEEAQDQHAPTQAMMKAAQLFNDKGQLTSLLMLKTLKRGQIPSFVAQFACFTGIRPNKLLSFLKDENANAMIITCRASGLTRDEFIGVYLMTHKLRTDSPKINHSEFNRAIAYFDSLGYEQSKVVFEQYRN